MIGRVSREFLFLAVIVVYFGVTQVAYSATKKVLSIARATIVKSVTDTGQVSDFDFDISHNADDGKAVIMSNNTKIVFDITGNADSSIFAIIKGMLDGEDVIEIKMKDTNGEIVEAKIRLAESKLTFDKNGKAKLELQIEIPPLTNSNKHGVYRATYNIILQH